jgi:hypothetical protein
MFRVQTLSHTHLSKAASRSSAAAACWLLEHQADLAGGHARTLPVVEVVLQVPVPDTELQLLQELAAIFFNLFKKISKSL